MHRILFTILSIFFSMSLLAQSDLVFFSRRGEVFYVYLNGVQQNIEPGSIISIKDVPAPNYRVKVRFHYERQSPPIEKEIFFKQGREVNYVIEQNKEGKFEIKFYSQVPKVGFKDTLLNHQIVDYTKIPLEERLNRENCDTAKRN